ncbi:MAG TPA: hypothetical protein VF656_09915 [Pyrinomonadaceae bacterium]|jgi:hypothetical protein
MSDYLWDKTGTADDDVAQLENLLGALKYRPRPLELPADAITARTTATATAKTTTPTRPATFFSRPRLALAASLVLMLLAGLWLVTRHGELRRQVAQVEGGGGQTSSGRQVSAAVVPGGTNGESAPAANGENRNEGTDREAQAATREKNPTPGREQFKARDHGLRVVAVSTPEPHRTSRQLIAKRRKSQPRLEENAGAPREEIVLNGGMRVEADEPLTPQQREATEQLMYALRLASAKLNYAQREMRDIGRAGK